MFLQTNNQPKALQETNSPKVVWVRQCAITTSLILSLTASLSFLLKCKVRRSACGTCV